MPTENCTTSSVEISVRGPNPEMDEFLRKINGSEAFRFENACKIVGDAIDKYYNSIEKDPTLHKK